MSTISPIGASTTWPPPVEQAAAAARTASRVDRDGDHDNNKPDASVDAARNAGATAHKLNIEA